MQFIPPLLPTLVTDLSSTENYLHEIKLDGYRIQAHLSSGHVTLYSRNGLNWTNKFLKIKAELEKLQLEETVFDGEIVSLDAEGKSQFHLLQRTLKKEIKTELHYFVFDLLFYQGEDLRDLPLWERKQKLQDIFAQKSSFIHYLDHITEHGEEFLKLSCDEGLEGIVSKKMNSKYSSGRSQQWIKVKCLNQEEFVVGGFTEHSSVPGKIGSLLLGEYRQGELHYIGKVGTGFSAAELKDLKKVLSPIETSHSPFADNVPKDRKNHWVQPKMMIQVKFQNWTNDRILRGAVFLGQREDKSLEEVEMHVEHISSPEKIIYQKEKITKEMIAQFYQEVSSYILKFSKNRPLSLVRCPQGTSAKCFFQKHLDVRDVEGIHFFEVEDKDGTNEYFSLTSAKGLLGLVQLNAYEFHGWNCHDSHIEFPDQIVLDLDPDENILWEDLVWASLKLRELLLDLDLESFVKLTGGKGVHLHVPITPKYKWSEVKSFAYTLGRELVERYPEKFTTNMSKKARKGKIFIDYLRNDRGSTAVLPYSLRTKEKATVAMPIEWEELLESESASRYGPEEALKKIKERKRDPWINYPKKEKQQIIILEH